MSKKAATPEVVDEKPIFRPLTRQSLNELNAQIRRIQTRRHEIECQKGLVDETENLSANPQLEAFKTLPIPLQRKFPKVLTSTPIHEIDSYYTEMEISSFVVINKNFDIWRFNTMSSLYMLTPFHPLRRVAIYILTHPYFSFFVIATILTNCALMTLPGKGPIANIVERTEIIFTTIYSFESCLKVIARGFIIDKFTYLRDGWNWLDFIVIVVAYITMFAKDLGNLSALRTFRVLRALKTVAIIPGLKTIVGAVIESVKNLKDVIVLTCFSLSLFALLGLQIYSGVLSQICIKQGPENLTNETWFAWYNDTSNHRITGDEQQDLCSNSTEGQQCKNDKDKYVCMAGFHSSPNWGYTNFDAFHFALLSAFRLLTQDAWESLYQMIIRTTGYWQILFFVTAIFFGSIYLVNLILAIVAMSYNELRKKVKAEEEAVKAEILAYQESLKLAEQNEKNSTPIINGHSLSPSDAITSQLYSLHSGPDLNLPIPSNRKLKPLTRAASTGDYEDNRDLERDVKYLDSFSLPDAGAVDNYDRHYTNSESVISGWNRRNNLQAFSSNYQSDSQRISPTNGRRRRNSVWALHGLYNSKDDKETNDSNKFNGITDPSNPFILQPSELSKLRRKSETLANGYAKPEKPSLKSRIKEKIRKDLNSAIDMFCIWDCCWCWVWVQKITSNIVFDPFMELFITLCIIVNTLFMAMDSNEAEGTEFGRMLNAGNTFFTTAFTLEAGLKLIALNPKFYFREGWNCFDFLIVSLSLLEKAFEGVSGFSVLRTFRLLRVFKLAKSWPTLNLLISIMGKTLGSLGNLTLVLIIIMFIFAVMGNQLFSKAYTENVSQFKDGKLPRWNFVDFLHSFMIIFRVLCGEWIECMWDCMHVAGWPCIPFFLTTVIIGNLVVLRLFLALLLSSFGASNLSAPASENTDTKKLQEAFERFARAYKWVKNRIRSFLKYIFCRTRNRVSDAFYDHSNKSSTEIVCNSVPEGKSIEIVVDHIEEVITDQPKIKFQTVANNILQSVKLKQAIRHAQLQKERTFDSSSVHSNIEAADQVYETDRTSEEIKAENIETVSADIFGDYPNDCFPEKFYRRFPLCNGGETEFWLKWKDFRYKCYNLVENKYFESTIIILILISSLTLALEDIHLKEREWMQKILWYSDKVFTGIFFFEMVLKWFAYGFKSYFSSGWCWLDFIIVMVSVINGVAELMGVFAIQAFKTMKTLRALRPLRAMSRMQGMRVVVNALIQAIPAIFNVLLVCLILWLIFAIMGVQFFSGKFGYCRVNNSTERMNATEVENKTACLSGKFNTTAHWHVPSINFDNVFNGYLALLQVATFKGWSQIIFNAVDSVGVDAQPKEESNLVMYAYFVSFVFCGSFFTLNLFIGVIIDNFNEQKKRAGGALEMLMTTEQKKYYSAMKKMGKRKPIKAIPRPRFKLQAFLFDVTTNKKFDMTIMVIILLNMLVMCLDKYQADKQYSDTLETLNLVFIGIFTVECLLKLFALRWYYFKEPWNIFDFVIVILSITGSLVKEWVSRYFVSPTMLRVIRVVKIGRVLRLVKSARGIRTLLFALAMSLPALFNICLLLFLITFIYAIFGMSFFMNVKKRGYIDDTFNFGTFFKSFVVLFPMCTSSGWSDVLAAISDESDCTPSNGDNPGDCGNRSLATGYLVTYLIITFFVIINMYIAVILENYSQAKDDVQQGLTNDDYDMFYEVWSRYDPAGTRFIHVSLLSDLLDALEVPLKIAKPNKFIIVSMDIPICAGDLCYCVEVLDALTKYFFLTKGIVVEENTQKLLPLYDDREHISSTLWRQRELYCALVLQKAWNKWKMCLTR